MSSLIAAAAVAQSVKHPELRSIEEVQLCKCKFNSGLGVREKNPSHAICRSVRQSTCTQK